MEKSPAEVKKVAVNAGGAGGSASGAGVDGGASADEDGVSYEYECFDSSRCGRRHHAIVGGGEQQRRRKLASPEVPHRAVEIARADTDEVGWLAGAASGGRFFLPRNRRVTANLASRAAKILAFETLRPCQTLDF